MTIAKRAAKAMHIAVQGCSHGSLSAIYDSVAEYTRVKGRKVDLLLLCGDFQALRNEHDFSSLAVPAKYRSLGSFHKFYSGKRVAPVLTIVIGGNHEASNYMYELYHGGWLAPNIYYLGAAGSVLVNGLRIVGASGIYKSHDYAKGHFETVPYTSSMVRSIYHIRQYNVAKLMQLPRATPTVFLSHDWPITIAKHGNTQALLQRKKFFRAEVENDTLGSPPLLDLLKHVQPELWFSAHLHVKFAAVYKHRAAEVPTVAEVCGGIETAANPDEIVISDNEGNPDEIVISEDGNPDEIAISEDGNPDEIVISDGEDDAPNREQEPTVETKTQDPKPTPADEVAPENPDEITISDEEVEEPPKPAPAPAPASPKRSKKFKKPKGNATRFLALDKCGPGKEFIQFLDVPAPESNRTPRLTFDPYWLAISRALHPYFSTEVYPSGLPDQATISALIADEFTRIKEEGLLVPAALSEADVAAGITPPLVFEKGLVDISRVQQFWPTAPPHGKGGSRTEWYTNPQTEAFCGMLGIENKINPRPGV